MNGRLYDPLLRRFLNADENIQDPHNTQNYNKYGYVMNNPLMYSDPSGEFFVFLGLGALFWKAVIIGAAVGLASYTVGLAVTGNLHQWNIGGALKSTFWGAVGGAVSFGVGEIFSVASEAAKGIEKLTKVAEVIKKAGGDFGLALVQAGTHAVSQGILAVVQGDSFLSAAAGGFFGSLGAKAWGGAMKNLGYEKFAQSTIGTVAFGALSGGVGAELSGGNFWQGAVTGGIVTGLNHQMHKIGQQNDLVFSSQRELDEYINERIGNKARIEKELKTKILLATDSNVEKHGYFLNGQGDMYRTSNGQMVGGITVPMGNNSSIIYIPPSAKWRGLDLPYSSHVDIVHELIHAMAFSKGIYSSETAASTYTYAYYKAYGYLHKANEYKSSIGKYPSSLSWRKLPSFINTGLKR